MRTMDPEERFDRFERQQEFLAASQAQHDARMAEISAFLAETSRRLDETAHRTEENSANIAQLGDLTLRIGRIVEEQAKQMTVLANSQTRTDERLNALINVVERYFSNGRK